MSRVPDLVRDSKLQTFVHPKYTSHRYHESDPKTGARTVVREECWQRVKHIGGGGYGTVWLEKCVKGDRDHQLRAVKEIRKLPIDRRTAQYNRELEAIAKFSHDKYVRCFVKSFGWYDHDGAVYIAMEYFPEGDLHRHLLNSPPLPENEAQSVFYQTAEGLTFLHENGFAHRDLKPNNILVSAKPPGPWWIKIGDFGISRRIEEGMQDSSSVKGTPWFMAPELHGFVPESECIEDAQLASFAADMWSLGVMTFQMLTKEASFRNMDLLSRFVKDHELFPSPKLIQAGVSEEGIQLIRSLMHPDPKQRPTAVQALAHDWTTPCRPSSPGVPSIESNSTFGADDELLIDNTAFNTLPSARWTTMSAPEHQLAIEAGAEINEVTEVVRNLNLLDEARQAQQFNKLQLLTPAAAFESTVDQTALWRLKYSHKGSTTILPDIESYHRAHSPFVPVAPIMNLQESSQLSTTRPKALSWPARVNHGQQNIPSFAHLAPGGDRRELLAVSRRQSALMDPRDIEAQRSAHVKHWVRLKDGHCAINIPRANKHLGSISPVQSPTLDEFTHCRFTAITCRPHDFMREHYILRADLYPKPRHTEVLVGINNWSWPAPEDFWDSFRTGGFSDALEELIHDVSFMRRTRSPQAWQSVVLVILGPPMSPEIAHVLEVMGFPMRWSCPRYGSGISPIGLSDRHGQFLGLFDDGMSFPIPAALQNIQARLYEYTIQRQCTLPYSEFIRQTQQRLDFKASFQSLQTPLQLMICCTGNDRHQTSENEKWLKAFSECLDAKLCLSYRGSQFTLPYLVPSIVKDWRKSLR